MEKCLYYQRGTQSLTLLLWYSVKEQLLSMDTWIPKSANERYFTLFKLVINLRVYKNKSTGTPHYVALYFASQVPGFFFFFFFGPKLISGNPELSKSLGTIFSPKHLFILCLCVTFLIVLTIFQMFSLLLDFLWCSVLSDLWCYYFGSLKAQMMVSPFSNKVFFNLNEWVWLPRVLAEAHCVSLGHVGSRGVRTTQLWDTGSSGAARGLSCSVACCWILAPWPEIGPVSPALQGGFPITGPPGKSRQWGILK